MLHRGKGKLILSTSFGHEQAKEDGMYIPLIWSISIWRGKDADRPESFAAFT